MRRRPFPSRRAISPRIFAAMPHGCVLVQAADVHAERPQQAALEVTGHERVAAEEKEVVVGTDRLDIQKTLELARDRLLDLIARCPPGVALGLRERRRVGEAPPIDLAADTERHGGDEQDLGGQHVPRQPARQVATHVLVIARTARRAFDVRDDAHRIGIVGAGARDHCTARDVRAACEGRLDLRQVDGMSMHLDAGSVASVEAQQAFRIEASEIPAAIATPSRTHRIIREHFRIEIGTPPIAGAQVPAAHDDLADLADGRRCAVLALDAQRHALHSPAGRHDAFERNRRSMRDDVTRNDPRFSSRELVEEHASRRRVRAELRDVAAEDGFPSQVHEAQVRQHALRRHAGSHLAPHGRYRVKDGDAAQVEPVRDVRDAVATNVVHA